MAEQRIRLAGRPDVEVVVKRSRQARRLSLRVSSLNGRVTLTLPTFVNTDEALGFLEDRQDWISRALARVAPPIRVEVGAVLPVEGKDCKIVQGRRPHLSDTSIVVPETRAGAAARGLLRARARDRLVAASDRYANRIGRTYSAITLRDTRSRWGSCTSEGRLMYSWRLAMAPPDVLDYVAAHEVAHLWHMDHSAAFWSVVETLCPDWREKRDWLRDRGTELHRYSFGD